MRNRKHNMETKSKYNSSNDDETTPSNIQIFNPPLPTLYSNYNPTQAQLDHSIDGGEEAQNLYDSILSNFNIEDPTTHAVPRRQYGKSNITVPIISLGGFVALGSSVMRNRKLKGPCGCGCKGMIFFACNGLIIPLLLFIIALVVGITQALSLEGYIPWIITATASLLIPLIWFVVSAWMIGCEHQSHLDRLLDYSYAVGIDHIETARHYLESEAQLKPVLQRQTKKNQPWLVQTKVRPYAQKGALYDTSKACLKTLGLDKVTFLTVHGVNTESHVQATLENSADEVLQMKKEGKADLVGLAVHCHTQDIIKLIETNKFDFVNLHFGFFSSYSNMDNQEAVLKASEHGLGVYCISPSNQGGELHKPSKKLIELCKPLHPLEFGLLYLLSHKGIGDTGTVSCGPTNYKELDYQLRAVQLLPYAAKFLPTIVQRLRDEARKQLGQEYCDGLSKRVGTFTQGNETMPGALSLSLLLGCHCLWKSFDNESYLKRMVGNLSWPGDWCAGGSIDVLRGKDENSEEMKQFRAALQDGDVKDGALSTDVLLNALREIEDFVPATGKKGCGKKILGKVMAYGKFWVETASWCSGYVPTREYGSMPKTKN